MATNIDHFDRVLPGGAGGSGGSGGSGGGSSGSCTRRRQTQLQVYNRQVISKYLEQKTCKMKAFFQELQISSRMCAR